MAGAPKTTLRKGSQGPDVAALQGWLNILSNEVREIIVAPLKVDGIFGTLTYNSVVQFQKMVALSTDGIVGPMTWDAINQALLSIGVPGIVPGSDPATWSFSFTDNDRPKPGWHEDKAWSLFEIRESIIRHNRTNLPFETIMAIFFEESLFANTTQYTKSGGKGGPADGFGQMQTGDFDKQPYFLEAGLLGPTQTMTVSQQILSSKENAVKIHVGWYNWLAEAMNKDANGILAAQCAGGNEHYIKLFKEGGQKIGDAFATRRRIDMIYALNHARANSPKKNSIPWPRFSKFWRFIIPDWSLVLGF